MVDERRTNSSLSFSHHSNDEDHQGRVVDMSGKLKFKRPPGSTLKTTQSGGISKKPATTKAPVKSQQHVDVTTQASPPKVSKTPTERAFEARQKEKLTKTIKADQLKSHKQRVDDFNKKLEILSEHHDLPKVTPG